MPDIVIHVVASALYAALALHFWNTRWRAHAAGAAAPAGASAGGLQAWERAAILAPLALHGALLYSEMFAESELRFGFAHLLSVMLWLAVVICWLEGFFYRIEAIYPATLVVAAACAPLPALFPGRLASAAASSEFVLHLVFGILAYSLFTVATLHALLIAVVEKRLHVAADPAQHAGGGALFEGPLSGLPPLLSLEQLVFRLIAAAFAVLTLTFAMGIVYSESLFGRAFRFDHKTVFLVLSWATFAALLVGRHFYGWRGRTALRWTLSGFVLLILAYVGSRFVLEVILQRG